MKEILKYLRQLNSFSQEEIARQLEISRQSYVKYENGSVIPNARIVARLAEIYKVSTDFIYANKIPQISENPNTEKSYTYNIDNNFSNLYVDEPTAVAYGTKKETNTKQLFSGIIEGNNVQITDDISSLNLHNGQKVKVYIEIDNEELERQKRKEAWETLMSFIGTLPADFDYKKALEEALEEKFGKF